MCINDLMVCKKDGCQLYKLYRRYRECKNAMDHSNSPVQRCDEALIILAESICDDLKLMAAWKNIKQACFLIFHDEFQRIMDIIGYKCYFSLCSNLLNALIALGVPDIQLANKVVLLFEMMLKLQKKAYSK